MTTVVTPTPADFDEPPPPTARVLTVGLIGVGLSLAAFGFGLGSGAPRQGFDPHWADGPRALLSTLGLLVAGCAVSMRPGWFGGWLCGAACGLIGYGFGAPPPDGTDWYQVPPRDWFAGVPNAWDSVQLFFGVAGAIGLIGAIWTRLPRRTAMLLTLGGVAYHFAAILSAVTSPPPAPYLSDQYWKRVSRPYVNFAYMNNAYQFYSPDPGPACQIWACFEYKPEGRADDPDAPRECSWVVLPTRSHDYKDPLGVSYYRRLALTENIVHAATTAPIAAEQAGVANRRQRIATDPVRPIPYRFGPQDGRERRVPNDLVVHQILPSYVRHLIAAGGRDGWEVRSVKVYRALHMIVMMPEFRGFNAFTGGKAPGKDPYNAAEFLPYFQGEFDKNGNMIDPTDPMLFWLVPILQKQPDWSSRQEYREKGYKYYFDDYVSAHAGCERPVE
jgi:hypothetical protein